MTETGVMISERARSPRLPDQRRRRLLTLPPTEFVQPQLLTDSHTPHNLHHTIQERNPGIMKSSLCNCLASCCPLYDQLRMPVTSCDRRLQEPWNTAPACQLQFSDLCGHLLLLFVGDPDCIIRVASATHVTHSVITSPTPRLCGTLPLCILFGYPCFQTGMQ